MLRPSLSVMVLLGLTASIAACAHRAPEVQTGPAAARIPRTPVTAVDAAAVPVHPFASARDGSQVILAERDGRTVAYVADEDDNMVRLVDVEDGRELSNVRLGGVPGQLVMKKDGTLFTTLRDRGQVLALSSQLKIEKREDVAADPVGLALSPDDAVLVVTSGWGKTVTVLDGKSLERRASHDVSREPRGVVVSSDGKRAFVSHVVGGKLDVIALDGTQPFGHDKDKKAKLTLGVNGTEQITGRGMSSEDQGRAQCQGFALARSESGRVFAPQVLAFTGDPEESSSGYGGGGSGRESEVFNVPVIDEDGARTLGESLRLSAIESVGPVTHCALPRAAAVGKAGLFVTCVGDNAVTLYDADAVNPHEVSLSKWSVPSGPTGIALDEPHGRAVVWSQFAHALTTIAIGDGTDATKPFALSSTTLPRATRLSEKVERGRALFHATGDDRVSADGRACASCHPDGRDDSLVWSSPNGPRQTPILAGRLAGAAPYGWNGDAADVSTHLVQTFKRLGGKGITGDDKDALMAYVSTMRPPPSVKAKDPDAVQRGLAIFRSPAAECSSCHGTEGDMPDGSNHDVKSRTTGDVRSKFDTPSLRFVSGSAPYFHDGRYKDLGTLLTKSDGKMGHTKQLSDAERTDLRAYLESL